MSTYKPDIAKHARVWWEGLQPAAEPSGRKGDPGALARLRRYASPVEAMADEATLGLYRQLGLGVGEAPYRLSRVAVIAMTLAHAREDDGDSVMRRTGRPSFDRPDDAVLKPIRFRRLLAARDDDDLAREMRRLVALAKHRLDVGELAAAIFFWGDEFWGDEVRSRWAFEYFAAGAAAPPARADTAA
jgi:CRISPR system Cascade subunit CasB